MSFGSTLRKMVTSRSVNGSPLSVMPKRAPRSGFGWIEPVWAILEIAVE